MPFQISHEDKSGPIPIPPITPWQRLKTAWKVTVGFMVHCPQPSLQQPLCFPVQRYSTKAKLYPFLPANEEQRDWLDRCYYEL